ncbi:MAG TPA: cation diffusion facilitator family transporter, partial [Acidobacteriota bacterium]
MNKKPIVVYAAIAANLLIAISKFGAAIFTKSSAMISEGIHSLVDTGNQLLLLLGIKRSSRPPDERHPFGHGKELYFWGLMVAIVLFGVGGGMSIYEGILHILHDSELKSPTVNYIVLGIAAFLEAGSFTVATREFLKQIGEGSMWKALRSSKDPSLYVVLLEDFAALSCLLIAFLGVYFGHRYHNKVFDGVASILIGLILATVAVFIVYETKGLLLGESADPNKVEQIREVLLKDPDIGDVNVPLTMHFGPKEILVNVRVRFRNGLTTAQIAEAINRSENSIKRNDP